MEYTVSTFRQNMKTALNAAEEGPVYILRGDTRFVLQIDGGTPVSNVSTGIESRLAALESRLAALEKPPLLSTPQTPVYYASADAPEVTYEPLPTGGTGNAKMAEVLSQAKPKVVPSTQDIQLDKYDSLSMATILPMSRKEKAEFNKKVKETANLTELSDDSTEYVPFE